MSENIFKKIDIASDYHFDVRPGIADKDIKRISEDYILNAIAAQPDSESLVMFSQCMEQSGTIVYVSGNEIRAKIKMVVKLDMRIGGEDIETKMFLTGDIELTNSLNDTVKDIVLKSVITDK